MKYDKILNVKFIQQDLTQKITYDSVFLAYFVKIKKGMKIMELGSGNGVSSILLKRFNQDLSFESEGIEIQHELYKNSLQNVCLNKLDIKFYNMDVRKLPKTFYGKYDIVFSNPPYMKFNNGKISPYKQRDIARREVNGTIEDFVKAAKLLLNNHGRFYLIWRTERFEESILAFRKHGLALKNLRFIHSDFNQDSYAFLAMAMKNAKVGLIVQKPLYIYENGVLSEELKKIYSI